MIIGDSHLRYSFKEAMDADTFLSRGLNSVPLFFNILKKNYGNLYEVTILPPEYKRYGNEIGIIFFVDLELKK